LDVAAGGAVGRAGRQGEAEHAGVEAFERVEVPELDGRFCESSRQHDPL
jgi:hypothetical protein